MTFGSLFSGIGGFDLGLERAGWTVAFQVELDPFCQRVLAERWPGIERVGDIRQLQPESQWAGDAHAAGRGTIGRPLDLLVGGFPCQDLSVAGKRAGLVGERSGLFWEIVRIATALRPTWGLFENVPGLLSSHGGRDMATVLEGLRQCWPVVGYRVLDSQHFGVAQRRRRVFFVGGPTEDGVAEILALTEGGGGHPAARREAGKDIAFALAASVRGTGDGHGNAWNSTYVGDHLARSVAAGSRYDGDTETFVGTFEGRNAHAMSSTTQTLKATPSTHRDGNPLIFDTTQVTSPKNYSNPKPGDPCHPRAEGAHPPLLIAAQMVASGPPGTRREDEASLIVTHALTGEGHDASEDGTGRGTPLIPIQYVEQWGRDKRQNGIGIGEAGAPSFTLDASYPHGVAGGSLVRRLTPLECERLQAFPDGWTCLCQPLSAYAADPDAAALACRCPDSPRYRALGNAVTVSVIEWLGWRLMAARNTALNIALNTAPESD